MAKRLVDGPSIYNESWDSPTRDVFLWLLAVGADNYGLQREQPRRLAEATGLTLHRVVAALEVLVDQEVILRYAGGKTIYQAIRRWQDFQRVSYPGRPTCALPPPEVLGKLSDDTRKLFEESAEKFPPASLFVEEADESSSPPPGSPPQTPSLPPPLPSISDALRSLRSLRLSQSVKNSDCDSGLTDEQKKAHTAAIDAFHVAIKQHTGLEEPPGWRSNAPRHAAAFFAECLRSGDTGQDLLDTIAEYFKRKRKLEDDQRARGREIKTNASFTHYRSQYTSLLRTVAERTKGERDG